MIFESWEKVKLWIEENKGDLYTAAVIFLVGLASFGLGRISILWHQKEPIRIEGPESGTANRESATTILHSMKNPDSKLMLPDLRGRYVVSKNGTAYHYPWCAGAQKIKEENKIWFKTKEEAQARGYKPAGNCDGL